MCPLLQGFSQAASKLSLRLWCHESSAWGKMCLQACVVIGRFQSLESWPVDVSSLLDVSWRPSWVSYGFSERQLPSSKPAREGLLARWKLLSCVIYSATFVIVYLPGKGLGYWSFGTILTSGYHIGKMKERIHFQRKDILHSNYLWPYPPKLISQYKENNKCTVQLESTNGHIISSA